VPPTLLSQEEIEHYLIRLQGWRQDALAICRDFLFPSFGDAVAFVNRVAEVAEEADHHPNIAIDYKRVSLSVTTWASGGLTRRDFRLAGKIDGL